MHVLSKKRGALTGAVPRFSVYALSVKCFDDFGGDYLIKLTQIPESSRIW